MSYYFDKATEAYQDELGAEYGDPRRCPRHPGQITSSPDGLHDAPCGQCEYEGDLAAHEQEEADLPSIDERLAAEDLRCPEHPDEKVSHGLKCDVCEYGSTVPF